MLRLLAHEMRVGIRKDIDAVVEVNGADFSARIARKARMADRIDGAGAHLLARLKARSYRHLATGGRTLCNQQAGSFHCQSGRCLGRARRWSAALQLFARYEMMLE